MTGTGGAAGTAPLRAAAGLLHRPAAAFKRPPSSRPPSGRSPTGRRSCPPRNKPAADWLKQQSHVRSRRGGNGCEGPAPPRRTEPARAEPPRQGSQRGWCRAVRLWGCCPYPAACPRGGPVVRRGLGLSQTASSCPSRLRFAAQQPGRQHCPPPPAPWDTAGLRQALALTPGGSPQLVREAAQRL